MWIKRTYRSLSLGSIHEYRADRRREHHIAETLSFKDPCSSLSSIECTTDIDVHNLLELLRSVFLSRMLGTNARIRHYHVQLSKIPDDLINSCRDFPRNGDIGLVSANLCLIFRSEPFCCLGSSCGCAIENSNLDERLMIPLSRWIGRNRIAIP